MKQKIKEIGTALLLPGTIITAMYMEKLLEIINKYGKNTLQNIYTNICCIYIC